MNPTLESTQDEPAEVDRLLHDFFHSELPREWPAPPAAASVHPAIIRPSLPWRSRGTLAASVAVLLIGSLWLCGSFSEKESGRFRPGSAVPTEARRPGTNRKPNTSLDSMRNQRPRSGDTRRR
jgi:hypothetical protein